ncbi:MAG: efflux transporter outer membrane subunit [Planctomycetota bacterium]|jgi:NodT family efflux transporter outer membrane factor (OMF) lipoprotein
MPFSRSEVCVAVAALLLLGGCCGLHEWADNNFKVGPNYGRPPAPVADQWIDSDAAGIVSQSEDYSYWWDVFHDPTLNELVDAAEEQNLSLRTAGMRIMEARAQLGIAYGSLFPQSQQMFGDYTRFELSETSPFGGPQPGGAIKHFDFWDVGFNATWELDFWGRFRRAIESSEADLDAQIENYDDVLVILQAEVASAYIQIRTLQERLRLAHQNVELQEETLRQATVRNKAGEVSKLDVYQAEENLANTRSLIPRLENGIRLSQNALCVLLGFPPRDLEAELGSGAIPEPEPSREILVGIPAELLRRRPDVRRAERQAAAQSARIGIAESDFYPRIAITGFIGLESEDFAKLFNKRSWMGNVGPGFRWNILNYGRIRNSVRAEEARFCQLVIEYQNRVLEANREVEDAINSFLQEKERAEVLAEAVTAAEGSTKLSDTQYREGEVDFQRVVDSQRVLVLRQDGLAASRGRVALNLVAMYKALGGGWQTRLGDRLLPTLTEAMPHASPQPLPEELPMPVPELTPPPPDATDLTP